MLETLYSLAACSTLLLAAFGFGRPLLRSLGLAEESPVTCMAWSLGLGFALAGWMFSILAIGNIFSPLAAGVATIAASFWGLGELACLYLATRRPTPAQLAELEELGEYCSSLPIPNWLKTCALLGFLLVGTATFVAAMAPPISPASISQALSLPKTVSFGASLTEAAYNGEATPRLVGMIYAWAFALDGPVAANLVSCFFGLLLVAATAIFARGVFERNWSWFTGALLLLSPGIVYQMSAANDDLPTAVFVTLALCAWWKATVEFASPRWFVLAGIFLGAGLASRFSAVVMLVAIAITWSIEITKHTEHRRQIARGSFQSLSLAILIAVPWWTWTFLNGGQLAPQERGASIFTEIGPWFLAFLPGLLLVRKLRSLHLIWGVAGFYIVGAALVAPGMRSFAMLMPALATLVTWVVMELLRLPRTVTRWIAAPAGLIAVALVLLNLTPLVDRWRVAAGLESRAAYLTTRVGSYAAADIANRVLPEHAKLLSEDPCSLYFDCVAVPATKGGTTEGEPFSGKSSAEWLTEKSREGFSHWLICRPQPILGQSSLSPTPSVRPELAEKVLPLTQYEFTDAEGRRRYYQLLMLRR